MRIGIYGGSFNPIHIGHLTLADQAVKSLGLSVVVFVPAGDPYFKRGSEMAPALDRLEMVRRATGDTVTRPVLPIEVHKNGPSYTSETLQFISDRFNIHGADELFLLVGLDSFLEMHRWHDPQKIADLASVWVYGRGELPEYSVFRQAVDALPKNLRWQLMFPKNDLNISSTLIRQRIADGESYRFLVPNSVYEYIDAKGLYRRSSDERQHDLHTEV